MTKDRVREIAAERGFAVATKPDSHDICFIPDGDTRGFLARRLGSRPGRSSTPPPAPRWGSTTGPTASPSASGRASGVAAGDPRPRYVLGIEPVTPHGDDRDAGPRRGRRGAHRRPDLDRCRRRRCPLPAEVQLRAHGTPVACEVTAEDGGLRIALAEQQRGVAPGQSAVLYEPDPRAATGCSARPPSGGARSATGSGPTGRR